MVPGEPAEDFRMLVSEMDGDMTIREFLSTAGGSRFAEQLVVDSFPDFAVQFVDAFPDIGIRHVSSFPGRP